MILNRSLKPILLLAFTINYPFIAYAKTQTSPPLTVGHRVSFRTSAFRKEDFRLEKKVSINRPQAYAGEILEILAHQTGVAIEASDADGAASEELVVILKEMPLADAMECITSLLSHQGVRWQWRREGNGQDTPYIYRLIRPENAIALYAEQTQAQIQADFENETEMMIAGLDMPPEELKRQGKQNKRMNLLATGTSTPLGIRTLRDSLTPKQRSNLLRDPKRAGVTIPVDKLSPDGQKLRDYMLNKYQQGNPEHTYNADSATFAVSESPFPVLWIGFGDLGFWSYTGGPSLQDTFAKRETDNWVHDNESKNNKELEAQSVPKPKDRVSTEPFPGNNQLPNHFAYLGEQSNFSVIARLERDRTSGLSIEPWEHDLEYYLKDVGDSNQLLHKWHETSDGKSVLLVDYMGWYIQDTDKEHPRFPWQVMKQFRAMDAGGNNAILLQTMLSAAATLDDKQLNRLNRQHTYPVAFWLDRNRYWLAPLSRFVGEKSDRYPALISSQGVSFKTMPDDLRKMLLFADGKMTEQRQTVLSGSARIAILPDGVGTEAFRLEVRDSSGNILTTVSAPSWKTGNTRPKN